MVEGTPHRAKEASHGNATNHDRRNTFRTKWTLEGRLVQPWISELKSTGRKQNSIAGSAGAWWTSRRDFIDKTGRSARRVVQRSAELIATGIYTRDVVQNIEKRKSNRQR